MRYSRSGRGYDTVRREGVSVDLWQSPASDKVFRFEESSGFKRVCSRIDRTD